MPATILDSQMLIEFFRDSRLVESAGGDFSASMAGKLKMVFQCIAAGAAFIALLYSDGTPTGDASLKNIPPWVVWTLSIFVWLTLISTLYSGAGYVLAAARFIRKSDAV